ncbi:hypothetical protein DIS18_09645 [Algibacter marinivivus]|uniref:Lipoprotein n=1 Tax=Algibacter marinivivus TaxID=2100723 RepID=A0A2U2X3Z5_9FLAO|nr:hypothetical protein [Algibacter marinivivus]PWH82505.1 hypothetical protein DIS18_09645 [Algibacter marinivivus]
MFLKSNLHKSTILLIIFIILSCSTSKKVAKEIKCPEIYENNFTQIRFEKLTSISENDTTKINEMRFKCVHSAFYTHKVMYDKFGKWDKEIYLKKNTHPILMWEEVNLFSNGKKYRVISNGIEEWKHIYASVMIFDKNDNDLLSDTSEEKEILIKYFGDLIKNNDIEKRDFYEVYWTTVNPKHWERIKHQRN